jgi:hypothetical protein
MDELGDGTSFDLTGHIVSTNHKDKGSRPYTT